MKKEAYGRLEGKVGHTKAFQVAFPNLPDDFWTERALETLIEILNDLPENHAAKKIITDKIESSPEHDFYMLMEAYRSAKEDVKAILLKKFDIIPDGDFKTWTEIYSHYAADMQVKNKTAGKIVSAQTSLEEWLNFMSKSGKASEDYGHVHLSMFLEKVFSLPATYQDWIAIREKIYYWKVPGEMEEGLKDRCLRKIMAFAEELEKSMENGIGDWKEISDLWEKVFSMTVNCDEEKNRSLAGMVKAARNVASALKFRCWEKIFENIAHYNYNINEPEKIQLEALEEIRKAEAEPDDLAFRFELHANSECPWRYVELRKIVLEKLRSTPIIVKTVGSWIQTAEDCMGCSTKEVTEIVCQKFQELWTREHPIKLSFKHLFKIAQGANRRKSVQLLELVMPRLISSAGKNIDKLGKILNLNDLSDAHREIISAIIKEQL